MPQTPSENFFSEALRLQLEARRYFDRFDQDRSVELSQRCIEFSIKGILLIYRTKFPYTHDPAPDLRKVVDLPDWFRMRIPRIELWSRLLADTRAFAVYGDAALGVPAKDIIDRKFADAALNAAAEIYADCFRVASERKSAGN